MFSQTGAWFVDCREDFIIHFGQTLKLTNKSNSLKKVVKSNISSDQLV